MNRLNQLTSDKRMLYFCNDLFSKEGHKHWKREYETYLAICQCIRRGYNPKAEWHDCDDCANYELIIHPLTLGAMGNHCQYWNNMTDDETRLLLLGRCPYWAKREDYA